MTHAKTLFVLALALAAAPSVAFAGSEAVSLGARTAFHEAAFAQLPKPVVWSVQRPQHFAQAEPLAQISVEAPRGAGTVVGDIDLAALLNKQQKSSLKYSLGGKDVWISGAFDRKQSAYVSILVDGAPAAFFSVTGLLDKEELITAGTAKYKLYLAPNPIHQMKSEIILENAADEDDKVRVTLKKMLTAVGAIGVPVKAGGQEYKVFYTDDIKSGRADTTAKCLTFILTEPNGEFHVFPIPAELVPADKIAVFKMFKDGRVGLMQKDGKLKVYDNI